MSKQLVAYFSATGVTAEIAKRLASVTGADLHEIVPQQPYTEADLNWMDKNSRSSIEMKDKGSRPPIREEALSMDQYDTIFLGFPIWWYVAPTIVHTFLETYDLSGKIIIPFATSGGSGMGETNRELRQSCKGAVLREGKRFSTDADEQELKRWTETL